MVELDKNDKSFSESLTGNREVQSALSFKLPSKKDWDESTLTLRGQKKETSEPLPKLSLTADEKAALQIGVGNSRFESKQAPAVESNKEKVEQAPLPATKPEAKNEAEIPFLEKEPSINELFERFVPQNIPAATSLAALILHGKNFTIQDKLGLSGSTGFLNAAKLVAIPTIGVAAASIYSDASKFNSGEHSKLLYGTALAFDGLAGMGAAAQLVSKKPLVAITCLGLLGRSAVGVVEHGVDYFKRK